jgi:cell division protein FtsZ
VTIDGARGILFNVTGGPNMSLYEVNQAAAIIRETAHPDANLSFGAVVDEAMGDEMRITVVATGFERSPARRQMLQPRVERPSVPVEAAAPASQSMGAPQGEPVRERETVQPKFSPNNLDIPAFLRRR